MKRVRLCAAVAGILAMSLGAGRADDKFEILGDASFTTASQPIVTTAYQEEAPPPPGAPPQQAPPAESAEQGYVGPATEGPYMYTGPTPSGPAVIHDGWSDVWTSQCGPWCPLGTIIHGVEGTFLVPVDEPNQTVRFTNLLNGQRYRGKSSPGLGSGVRSWIGLQQNGTGIRARYWFFGNDLLDVSPEVPIGNGPAFIESYYLRAQTVDIELFHEFCFAHGTLDASFGGRYASLRRTGAVTGFGTVGNVDVLGLALGSNEVEGTGLTASIGGRKPLGCFGKGCDSCVSCNTCCAAPCGLNFFWNFRGSVLWADSTVSVLTDANAITKPPIGAASASSRDKAFATNDHSENVFIADLQLGLEYNFGVCCLPGLFSVRGGVEWQHWETGDLIARSNSFAALQGGPPPFGALTEANADAHDGDLDLIGFFVGLQWKF